MHEWKAEERCIFHVDVNSAFLSWSALKKLKEEPGSVDLRTIPSAVGGDVQTRHGIITAKSIPAKKYGIQTGEPVVKALQKCPSLVLVRSDFAVYRQYSRELMQILREYTDLVEQVSIDEAYLDMTQTRQRFRKTETEDEPWPLNAAHEIRKRVFRELGFTVNVGISVNRLLAKTASDFAKPDRVHTLFPEEVPEKLWPLPMQELHGCGKATAARLKQLGVMTVGQAAGMSLEILQANLGVKAGEYIWNSANGISSSVIRAQHEKAKSYSNEETTAEDITRDNYDGKGRDIVERLSRKVAARMEKAGVYAQTVSAQVKTGDFQRHSRQVTLPSPTREAEVIYREAERLMESMLFGDDGFFAQGKVLRLIGVGCANLSDGSYRQMDLFAWAQEAREKEAEKQRLEEEKRRREAERQRLEEEEHRREEERQRLEEEERRREEERQRLETGKQEEIRQKKERLEMMMQKVRARYGTGAITKGAGPDTGGSGG